MRTPGQKFQEEQPGKEARKTGGSHVRLPVLASLISLALSSNATSAPLTNFIGVDGVRLTYVEQGSGEPIVPVHGAFSDLRVWEPIREEVAKRYRFIAYTQRIIGTEPWPDDGKNFSIEIDADDLAKFITSLNAGPVHLVTRSAAVGWGWPRRRKIRPVRTPTLHEPASSPCYRDSPEGKAAREDREKFIPPQSRPTRPATRFGPL